jgi:hypothetical protein
MLVPDLGQQAEWTGKSCQEFFISETLATLPTRAEPASVINRHASLKLVLITVLCWFKFTYLFN